MFWRRRPPDERRGKRNRSLAPISRRGLTPTRSEAEEGLEGVDLDVGAQADIGTAELAEALVLEAQASARVEVVFQPQAERGAVLALGNARRLQVAVIAAGLAEDGKAAGERHGENA